MAQNYARSVDGLVVETFETDDDITTLFPPGYFQACGVDVVQGWSVVDGVYAAPSAAPPEPTSEPVEPQYVRLATIRDRVTAAGRWTEFATALDGLSPDKRWHLLTLSEGVSPNDPDANALLTAVGCDPSAILAVE